MDNMMGLGQLKKGAVAGVLCFTMLSGNVMAAEVTKTDQGVRKITYEQAVEMAIKNDVTMEDLSQQITFLQDNKTDMFVYSGGGNEPTVPDDMHVLDGSRMAFLSTVYNYGNNIEISKLSTDMTKIGAGAVVKQYFATIAQNESSLKLAKENYLVQNQLFGQGQLKNDLGYMSDMDYAQLKRDTDQAKRAIELLELDMTNTYTEFNKLLGLKSDVRYELVYDVEFEPVVVSTNIGDYASRMVSSDLSLRIQALQVDSNEFAAKIIADSSTVADYRTRQYTFETSSRGLDEAKKQKSVNIHSAYIQLQQLEKNRDNLILALDAANNALEKAEINYNVGNITKLAYDQAKLGVTKAQDTLQDNLLTHDLLKYTFANTCVLGNVGGSGAKK